MAETLPPPERLLLDGIRLWAAAARHGEPPNMAPRLPFIAEGAEAALAPIDALMRAAGDTLTAACPLCPRVAPAEARLLLGCALTQRGARREAFALLLHHLPPLAAQEALAAAIPARHRPRPGRAAAAQPTPLVAEAGQIVRHCAHARPDLADARPAAHPCRRRRASPWGGSPGAAAAPSGSGPMR
ncbi:hypothetical protein [Dankookia sp. P2]|uniref:hypothetical protein n=1 Tax=Dankookia sp. P2 TaxID=3423955 RepID=UPI003D678930